VTKNIVICCDGTGNEIGRTISNVLKLFRVLEKSDRQRVYYNPGVGTIGHQNPWQRFRQKSRAVFGLATGYGLDDDVLAAYRFLCQTHQPGDRIWLFGFSRGAYTVRVLAALLHVIGLLREDQTNLAGHAFFAYKRASGKKEVTGSDGGTLEEAWHFGRVSGARAVRIEFVGVWDTVASVIVPREDRLLPDLQTLRHTRTNPCVKRFRQAIAIDERRRSKFPLAWMIEEAHACGLHVNRGMVDHLVHGVPQIRSGHCYVPPCVKARQHQSMNMAWQILEWLPKRARWREWDRRRSVFGWYLPRSEPRAIPEDALIHRSVQKRMEACPGYRPVNLPGQHRFVDTRTPSDGVHAPDDPADEGGNDDAEV
jgi:uncharacterized protein (DUF2235 family)